MTDTRTPAQPLAGRTALVTGSARGIGWGIALGLAAAGAHVVLNALDAAALEPKLAELKAAGLKGSAEAFDARHLVGPRSPRRRHAPGRARDRGRRHP